MRRRHNGAVDGPLGRASGFGASPPIPERGTMKTRPVEGVGLRVSQTCHKNVTHRDLERNGRRRTLETRIRNE